MKLRYPLFVICLATLIIGLFNSANAFGQLSSEGPETLDVIIVMDNSLSNDVTDPDNLRQYFTRALAHLFSADADFNPTRFGLILFNTDSELVGGRMFDANDQELTSIEFPKAKGYTVIDKPLQLAYETFKNNNSYNGKHVSAVIYLTDGRPEEDEKPGPQPQEVETLFKRSDPWVKKLAEGGTRLYVVSYAGGVTLKEERWQEFAEMTKGDYREVNSVQEATSLFIQVVAQSLLGYNPEEIVPPTKMAPFETLEKEFEVFPATNRLIVFTIRLDPGTQVNLYRPDGEVVTEADTGVLVRGGQAKDRDKVWRIDTPEEGIWKLEFKGGTGLVQAWRFYRPFDIQLDRPAVGLLQKPNQPIEFAARAVDHIDRTFLKGEISKRYPVSMVMKITEPPPRQITHDPISMDYNPETGEFSSDFDTGNLVGKYLVQLVLTTGKFTLAVNEFPIYVGYTPQITNADVLEANPNSYNRFQVEEPLRVKVNVAGSENAAKPGTMILSGLLHSPTGEIIEINNPDFRSDPENQGVYLADLPPLAAPGMYTGSVWLSGKTKDGHEYGGDLTIKQDFEFNVVEYDPPQLLAIYSDPTAYWRDAVEIIADVKRFANKQRPSIKFELINSDGVLVESAEIPVDQAQTDQDVLRYTWNTQPLDSMGSYTIRVNLVDSSESTKENIVKVTLSPKLRYVLIAALGGLILALLGLIIWLLKRPLVPVVVVGTMDIIYSGGEKKTISLTDMYSRRLAIGRDCEISLNKDPDILGPVARLLARIGPDRRSYEPPILKSLRQKNADGKEVEIKIRYNPLEKSEDYQRQLSNKPDGVEITIGDHYKLIYKFGEKEARKSNNA